MAVSLTLLTLGIVGLGYITFSQNRHNIELDAKSNLASLADMKVNEVIRWREQQLYNAATLSDNSNIGAIFDSWLRAGSPINAQWQMLINRLGVMQRNGNYEELVLFDTQGTPRLGRNDPLIGTDYHKELSQQAVSSRQVIMSDMHRSARGRPEIDLFAPLLSEDKRGVRAVGVLHIVVNPARFLFPMLQTWPSSPASAETLLVTRDNDHVLFLNELRKRTNTALRFRLPLSTAGLPAAQAVLGKTGFVAGTDHLGHAVIAQLRQIPDTNWSLVVKIDEAEVYASVRAMALWSGAITLLLLGACFVAAWLQVHRNQLALRHRRLLFEKQVVDKRFETLSRYANDIFLLLDGSGRIVEANEQAITAYGYTRSELLQMHGSDLCDAESASQFSDTWQTILARGRAHYEAAHRCKDGGSMAVDISARLLPLESGTFVQMILRDISKRKAAEKRLHELAYYDELTGLPNRRLLIDHLHQAITSAAHNRQMVGVLMMDLDRFKTVNDTLGHDSGNQLLRQVTQRLLSCLRDGDTLARIGGDEFALVLPDMTQADDAARIARDIAQAFNACIVVDGSQVFVSLSIGIALYPLDDRDGATLLRDADSAMYHAKTLGRGNFQFYSAELTQRARQRMTLETGLRQALEREEFKLHYQAQVDIKTGQVLGVEALLRWDQPGTGAVSPASFIGVAEDCGLIVSLGEWVLRTACAQAKAWHAQGFTSLTMAVNLSARQFAPGKLVELVELIKSVLEETGLPAHCLELEITESILIDNADATVLAALREFKRMGITLALDDFGTGYCSLSYLKRFPIDKLKIDKSFIQGITSDPDDAALVRAIIAMARSLRLCVIAEGVETQEQYEHLRQQDCDQMQGNYFSHPASAQTVNELFKVLEYFPVPLARDKPHR